MAVGGLCQVIFFFKLSQYSPEKLPVNMISNICCLCPPSLVRLCKAKPHESKARFVWYKLLLIIVWAAQLLCFLLLNPLYTFQVISKATNTVRSSYDPPQDFQTARVAATLLYIAVLAAQCASIFVWALGNSLFRVRPRLARIILRRAGRDPERLYDVEHAANKQQRKKRSGGGSSSTTKGGGGVPASKQQQQQQQQQVAGVGSGFRPDGHLLRNAWQSMGATNGASAAASAAVAADGGLLESVAGAAAADEDTTVHEDKIYLHIDSFCEGGLDPPPPFRFRLKVDYVDATDRHCSPPPGMPSPILTFHVLPHDSAASGSAASDRRPPPAPASVHRRMKDSCVFDVLVDADSVLGLHHLHLKQPLASPKTVQQIELREERRRSSSLASFSESFSHDVRAGATTAAAVDGAFLSSSSSSSSMIRMSRRSRLSMEEQRLEEGKAEDEDDYNDSDGRRSEDGSFHGDADQFDDDNEAFDAMLESTAYSEIVRSTKRACNLSTTVWPF